MTAPSEELKELLLRTDEEFRELAGKHSELESRLDALSSKRVYKQAWSEQDVLDELRKASGIKFDPELIEIFFEILPNIKQVRSLYPEQE